MYIHVMTHKCNEVQNPKLPTQKNPININQIFAFEEPNTKHVAALKAFIL